MSAESRDDAALDNSCRVENVLDQLEVSLRSFKGSTFFPLHIGRTSAAPPVDFNEMIGSALWAKAHEYSLPRGFTSLCAAVCEYQLKRFNFNVVPDQVQITVGGTHALHVALASVVAPGSEVVVLSPQWLFTCGVIRTCGAVPVEVPVFLELSRNPDVDFIALLEMAVSRRTRAVYFNSPNNPTGYSLSKLQLRQLASWCRHHGFWLLADNAYEEFDFSVDGFTNVATFPEVADLTLSVHTFSKSFSLAGFRVGYLIAPQSLNSDVRRCALNSVHSVASASQQAALLALRAAPQFTNEQHRASESARDLTERLLVVPGPKVSGGFYKLLDLSALGAGGVLKFINQCIQSGVSLAPGAAFGKSCSQYARLCYMSVRRDDLLQALRIVNATYVHLLASVGNGRVADRLLRQSGDVSADAEL